MTIDWNQQWELHAPHFKNGYAHVNLQEFGGPPNAYKMAPGPGFGDLSHPTTRIMLTLMPKKLSGTVIDIGCGSGVLSLAAKKLGAQEVIGIDIDEDALIHAHQNAQLNRLSCTFTKVLPDTPQNPLLLMNMISSEQAVAWKALPAFPGSTLIVSGFPTEENIPAYGTILETLEFDGWKGFIINML